MLPFLTEENLRWKAKAHEIAEQVVRPLARKYDELQEYPWEIKDALAEAGLLGVWIPKEYGGAGAGVLDLCLVRRGALAAPAAAWAWSTRSTRSARFPILLVGHGRAEEEVPARDRLRREAHRLRPLREVRGQRRRQPAHPRRARRRRATSSTARRSGPPTAASPTSTRVFAVTDPETRSARGSRAFIVEKGDPGLHDREGRGQDGHPLRARRRAPLRRLPRSPRTACSAARPASASSTR